MNESTRDWSPNKDRGRQRGGSEDDEDEDFMHEEGVDSLPLTAGSRTHSAQPTGEPKEAQHPKHAAPPLEAQTWQTLLC